MSSGFRELAEVQVSIDKVVYVPTLEAPADRPFPFVYSLRFIIDRPKPFLFGVANGSLPIGKL